MVGSSSAEFDSAVIFIPGENTWHGFEPRTLVGVRRLMEINYVRPSWRSVEQLAFPDRPIKPLLTARCAQTRCGDWRFGYETHVSTAARALNARR